MKLAVRATLLVALALPGAGACVYFNAVYNANELFDRGRDEIRRGNESSGRAALSQSIEKAEKILANSPDSRWADDAMRLITRARLLRGEWEEALDAGRRLQAMVTTHRDSAEVAGFLGIAHLHLDHPGVADSLIGLGLARRGIDGERRAVLLYNRGKARAMLGRTELADADLQEASRLREDWIPPRLERMRLLSEQGRAGDAAAELRALLRIEMTVAQEGAVYQAAERLAALDPESASMGLARVESSKQRRAARARLLVLRGRARAGRGDYETARDDYDQAARLVPRTGSAVEARLARARLELRLADSVVDLDPVARQLEEALVIARGSPDPGIRKLYDEVRRVRIWVDHGKLGYLIAAEATRDKLRAHRLARHLFLEYAREHPDALWAPKALLAALDLSHVDSDGPGPEEIRHRLYDEYRGSAYVQTLLGGQAEGFTYEELETGLRRQLDRLRFLADQELQRVRSTSRR